MSTEKCYNFPLLTALLSHYLSRQFAQLSRLGVSLSLQICDDTSPAYLHQKLPFPTATAVVNASSHSTAALFPLPAMPSLYQTWAEILLAFSAVSFDIPDRAISALHAEQVIAVLTMPCCDITLIESKVRTPDDYRRIVSKRTKNSETSATHSFHWRR